jgi:hypothetical protein
MKCYIYPYYNRYRIEHAPVFDIGCCKGESEEDLVMNLLRGWISIHKRGTAEELKEEIKGYFEEIKHRQLDMYPEYSLLEITIGFIEDITNIEFGDFIEVSQDVYNGVVYNSKYLAIKTLPLV